MKKIWFIFIEGKKDGPFSISDLKSNQQITPDTLVWRIGFLKWKKIREVPELNDVFADDDVKREDELINKGRLIATPHDEIILDLQKEPPYIFWIIIVLLLILYVFFQFFWVR